MLAVNYCLWLTGPYFSPIDLANFARELDDAELEKMSEGDTTSAEYMKFLQVTFNTKRLTCLEPGCFLLSNHLPM